MFTGIIESSGVIKEVLSSGTNRTFIVHSPLSHDFHPDQSVSHNGVCLTIESVSGDTHRVTAIAETLEKTNLGEWQTGDTVNLERCLQVGGRLDGHFVQGHVDSTGVVEGIQLKDGSREISIRFPEKFAALMIEKGSICVDGISLTAFNITRDQFTVAIIPYTLEHTNLGQLTAGRRVNLEFDLIGKYITRMSSLNVSAQQMQ